MRKDIGNHVCGECEYAASYKGDLKKHIKRHHVCGECGYIATQKKDLKSHRKYVHNKGDKQACLAVGKKSNDNSVHTKYIERKI